MNRLLGLQSSCFCGSGNALGYCCGLYIFSEQKPATAEILMRSRYSAYCLREIEYLWQTTSIQTRASLDKEAIMNSAQQTEWKKLTVLKVNGDQRADSQAAIVEFEAFGVYNGQLHRHHEISSFQRESDRWYYHSGTVTATVIKWQRNEPCVCGSGKKYKKCCGG